MTMSSISNYGELNELTPTLKPQPSSNKSDDNNNDFSV